MIAEILEKPPHIEMTLEQLVQQGSLADTSTGKSDSDDIVVLDDK